MMEKTTEIQAVKPTHRDIKFRAWDKFKKVFIPNDVYAVITTDFNSFGVMLKDWENYKEGEYFYANSQELQQYVGIKDKQGKEIYEGDIVDQEKWISVGEYVPTIAVVKYRPCEFYCECLKEWVGSNAVLNGNATVIGNVYENSNLL